MLTINLLGGGGGDRDVAGERPVCSRRPSSHRPVHRRGLGRLVPGKGIDDPLVEGFAEDLLDEQVLLVSMAANMNRTSVADFPSTIILGPIVDGAENDRLGLLLDRLLA